MCGTYVEMGQFTDAGSIETNWHRLCAKDIQLVGSWGLTANDMALGMSMLDRARDRYPWRRNLRFRLRTAPLKLVSDWA